jgi:hypothetical protein
MSKITRSKLKGIVKECLVELLSEGLDSTGDSVMTESKKRRRKKRLIHVEDARLAAHRKKFETKVSNTVSHVTDDPIMQDILEQTARTTLQEQISHESSSTPGLQDMTDAAPGNEGIDLNSIFSAPKQNWATLAFPEK